MFSAIVTFFEPPFVSRSMTKSISCCERSRAVREGEEVLKAEVVTELTDFEGCISWNAGRNVTYHVVNERKVEESRSLGDIWLASRVTGYINWEKSDGIDADIWDRNEADDEIDEVWICGERKDVFYSFVTTEEGTSNVRILPVNA